MAVCLDDIAESAWRIMVVHAYLVGVITSAIATDPLDIAADTSVIKYPM